MVNVASIAGGPGGSGQTNAVTGAEAAAPLPAVDGVVTHGRDGTWWIRARKVVNAADPYLEGHFPGATIYPGVFILESVRQAVATGLAVACRIVSVCSVRFYAPLVPGDVLVVDVAVGPAQDDMLSVTAQAMREPEGARVAKMSLLVRLGKATDA